MSDVRWEQPELQRSRERGVWDRWGVQSVERRGGWLFFMPKHNRIYAPLEHPELPHQFAAISSRENTLISFIKGYGRLGWYELVNLSGESIRRHPWGQEHLHVYWSLPVTHDKAFAEPVEWVEAHARTVYWCLQAGRALRLNGRERHRICESLCHALPTPAGIGVAVESGQFAPELTIDRKNPLVFVGAMLATYLESNLRGVRRRVEYRDGHLYALWGGNTLLESIYSLTADSITGGQLGQCQSCGAVFIQTDGRQRFCPPRPWQSKSTCMNRERVRRQRAKSKKQSRRKR
jgi:hypothetical protein